jgi:hypothetical protein
MENNQKNEVVNASDIENKPDSILDNQIDETNKPKSPAKGRKSSANKPESPAKGRKSGVNKPESPAKGRKSSANRAEYAWNDPRSDAYKQDPGRQDYSVRPFREGFALEDHRRTVYSSKHVRNYLEDDKTEAEKAWISSFMSNVLGVIVGISLTFGISFILQLRNENEDTQEIMILIKKELKQNKIWLESWQEFYLEDLDAYKKILDANVNRKKLPADSLAYYIGFTHRHSVAFASTNVWDIYKNSSVITKYYNKNLTLALAECYFWINVEKESIERYYQEKDDAHKNIYVRHDMDPYAYLDALMKDKGAKYFLEIHANKIYNYLENITMFMQVIDYSLLMIDKNGYYNDEKIKYNNNSALQDFIGQQERNKHSQKDTIEKQAGNDYGNYISLEEIEGTITYDEEAMKNKEGVVRRFNMI